MAEKEKRVALDIAARNHNTDTELRVRMYKDEVILNAQEMATFWCELTDRMENSGLRDCIEFKIPDLDNAGPFDTYQEAREYNKTVAGWAKRRITCEVVDLD
jgi:hypothetical protein